MGVEMFCGPTVACRDSYKYTRAVPKKIHEMSTRYTYMYTFVYGGQNQGPFVVARNTSGRIVLTRDHDLDNQQHEP